MMIGTVAPEVSGLKFVQGDEVKIGQAPEAGKKVVTVVEFWATFSKKDVYFVGITDEQDEAKIKAFITQMGTQMSYPIALDTHLEAKRKLFQPSGARGIPHVILIGVDGKVKWMGHPMDPKFESELNSQSDQATERGGGETLVPLPVVTESFEELMGKSVGFLKGLLNERKIDFRDCFEKSELARRVVEKASSITYYKTVST
ncbi:hypothetical protein HDU67_009709 [Dinochytrium kinnereticum]|nr:hypothetical protein HDU67_009709 [Dinochytrium kinnereticum]